VQKKKRSEFNVLDDEILRFENRLRVLNGGGSITTQAKKKQKKFKIWPLATLKSAGLG
jgi:hypothetical protein